MSDDDFKIKKLSEPSIFPDIGLQHVGKDANFWIADMSGDKWKTGKSDYPDDDQGPLML